MPLALSLPDDSAQTKGAGRLRRALTARDPEAGRAAAQVLFAGPPARLAPSKPSALVALRARSLDVPEDPPCP